MKVSLKWLEDHVDLAGLTVEKLGDLLTFAGVEVEDILILETDAAEGTPLRDVIPSDTVFDLEVTPNRTDLLGHRGIARELAALTGRPLKTPEASQIAVRPDDGRLVVIDALSHCPFYSAHRITGMKVGPSPAWLRDKLTSVGLRPINNIVDITNYVLLDTGQPLHAFDAAHIAGPITVRRAFKGERFVALDGNEYILDGDDVVIADDEKVVALGGVMGGDNSGVTETTTDIILEAAYFTPACIRRTARRLNLGSDSSFRFERGVDPQGVLRASALARKLILEVAGGEAAGETLTAGEVPALSGTVEFDEDRARALLGAAIESEEMYRILQDLGLKSTGTRAGVSSWKIPSHRLDLQRHIDLVEEVARVYGLDKIVATLSASPAEASSEDRAHDRDTAFREKLCALGFFEIKTIKLISRNRLEDHLVVLRESAFPVRLKNPLSEDHTLLRPGLIPGLLEVAERNVHQGITGPRLFEIGTVFRAEREDGPEIEEPHLGILLGGDACPPSWLDARPRPVEFFDLRGIIESLFPGTPLQFEPRDDSGLVLSTSILAGGTEIGRAGQIRPARSRAMNFNHPIYVAELSVPAFAPLLARKDRQFKELDRYPAVARDIAMEVPADLPNIVLDTFFRTRNEALLVSAQLFDVFKDESGTRLAADKKSLAYSLTYRDKNATLTAGQVDEAHAKILNELVKELSVQIR